MANNSNLQLSFPLSERVDEQMIADDRVCVWQCYPRGFVEMRESNNDVSPRNNTRIFAIRMIQFSSRRCSAVKLAYFAHVFSLSLSCVASTRNFITPSNSALRACRGGFTTGLVHRKDVRVRAVRRRAASLRRVVKMERSRGLTICIERDEQRRKFIQTSAGSTTNSRTTQGLLTELNVEEDPVRSANCAPSDTIKRNGALNERDRFSIRRRLSRCSLKYTAEMESPHFPTGIRNRALDPST